ncbi:MAG: C40 family peptidase [Bacteroidales bacterium]|jgi:hypothetical protein|nr:C40 family peptidase [Bacteroidales bacterium]
MNMRQTLLLTVAIVMVGCGTPQDAARYGALKAALDSIRQQYAPDRRDEVFDVQIAERNGIVAARGATTLPDGKSALLQQLRTLNPDVVDEVRLLPDSALRGRLYGVINVSVADARMAPDYAAEMGTQFLLGNAVSLLQYDDGWYRVRGAEGYLSWTESSELVPMTAEEFQRWSDAPKLIVTGIYGFTHETPSPDGPHVSDVVFGDILKFESDNGSYYGVSYPDGRRAYIARQHCRRIEEWAAEVQLSGVSLVTKALTLRGIPYTWGGTSPKALDCSGFSRTVYLMHNVLLRRDASQQAKTGLPVDISDGYGQLRPGDLLFFGRTMRNGRERIRHVALYMGDDRFIHASGYVRVNSLNPDAPDYDAYNTRELIRATRIIGAVNTPGIKTYRDALKLTP